MELSVIPECYIDTNLIETVVPPKDERFRKLFKALRDHRLGDLELLSSCIHYLVAHPFNADLEILKAM